ncbi:UNVERIFIED_CONTAM: hypothetical protein RMT77_016209 [Armadillidium vulgare]
MSKNIFKISCLIITLVQIGQADVVSKEPENSQNETSQLFNNMKEIQSSLDEISPSNENLNVLKALTASLLKVVSQIDRMELSNIKLRTEIEGHSTDMSKQLYETECSLSTRIIDMENQLSSFKNSLKAQTKMILKNRGLKKLEENQESKDADPIKIAEIENLRTKLFAHALNMDYPTAIRQCQMKGNKVFIPKTKEENDLWIDFWSETSNNKFLFSSAFYPKMFNFESRRFIWADGKEHPEYYNISVPNSSLSSKLYSYYKEKDTCLAYFNKISTDNCVPKMRSTFMICEYA